MPGMTLCGEALTFAHDQELLGFCLNNPDEPAGDDFDTRVRNNLMGGAWIDPQVGSCTQEDLNDADGADDEEEGETPDGEVRARFVRYCTTTPREQRLMIYRAQDELCNAIGADIAGWLPSEELALEVIQDDPDHESLRQMAESACWEALRHDIDRTRENISVCLGVHTYDWCLNEDVIYGWLKQALQSHEIIELAKELCPAHLLESMYADDIDEDLIRIAHQGGHTNNGLQRDFTETKNDYVKHEIGERKADRCCARISNSRRRTCFFRARRETLRRNWDLYNEDPFEIKMQQQDEAFQAYVEYERETPEVEFLSVRDQLMMQRAFVDRDDDLVDDDELNYALREMEGWKDSGYRPYPRLRRVIPIWDDPFFDDFPDDRYDEWLDGVDDEPAHPATCYCSACLEERFSNGEDHCSDPMCSHCNSADGIFAGFGEDDRSVDEQLVRFGSPDRIRNSVDRGRRA